MTALATCLSGRLTLPVVRQIDVQLPNAEHARLSELAARIAADEPALSCFDVFGRDVVVGLDGAPALLFEDHSEISLCTTQREEVFRYRSLLLAGDGDLVLIGGRRHAAFEQYCRDVVGMGDPSIVALPPLSRRRLSSTLRGEDGASISFLTSVPAAYGSWPGGLERPPAPVSRLPPHLRGWRSA